MKKIELKDVKPYDPAKHFNMTALKLHDKESTGSANFVGLSHFLPGGGAEYDDSPTAKIYFVLEGEVTVKTPDKEIILKKYDSISILPNEGREIINNTNLPASMLVIIRLPD